MLISLIVLVTLLLTGDFSWFTSDTSHATFIAPKPLITPEEPRTLTLALIGIGTIAVYAAASRWWWRRRGTLPLTRQPATELREHMEQPSRGAA